MANICVVGADASEFMAHFEEYVAGWQERCVPVDSFRALQREKRISVSSRTTFGKEERGVLLRELGKGSM